MYTFPEGWKPYIFHESGGYVFDTLALHDPRNIDNSDDDIMTIQEFKLKPFLVSHNISSELQQGSTHQRPTIFFVRYVYIPDLNVCRYRISRFFLNPSAETVEINPDSIPINLSFYPGDSFWDSFFDDLPSQTIVCYHLDSFFYSFTPSDDN